MSSCRSGTQLARHAVDMHAEENKKAAKPKKKGAVPVMPYVPTFFVILACCRLKRSLQGVDDRVCLNTA